MKVVLRIVKVTCLVLLSGAVLGQSLYKYRGPDGEWVFTDRRPSEEAEIEVRALARGDPDPRVNVAYEIEGEYINLYARNDYHAPVQLVLGLDELRGLERPSPDQSLRFVVPPRSTKEKLIGFRIQPTEESPLVAYRYLYLLGDPAAVHRPERPYRAPFAVAGAHRVSQAFPMAITHNTRDSAYAVDIAMPVGTDIYAARGGVVVDVASTNYRGGTDTSQTGAQANIVRILHDDGTYAIYAHLNWNGIRVRPGDVVTRGQYIADSGNTGFSSGPHLHFVVLKNSDMRLESLPVTFEGANGEAIPPTLGMELTAY